MTENKDKLARIKAVRAGNRGVITKLSKEAEWILKEDDVDKGRLQTISGLLDEKLRLIKELDSQVLDLCELKDIEAEIDEAEDVVSRTLDIQRHIKDGITKKPVSPEPMLAVNSQNMTVTSENTSENTSNTSENTSNTSENTSNTSENTSDTSGNTSNTSGNTNQNVQQIGENSNNLAVSNSVLDSNSFVNTDVIETPQTQLNSPSTLVQIRPKLPKLILSKFRGNVTEWTGFWDSFKVAVHENPQLSQVDKFNYLHTLLEGAAARAIQGLTLTAVNYKSAIDILQERFGKTQRIITSHMDELLKIPVCTSDRSSALRFVYDKISIHVRGLASLGVSADQYGSLLIPIIMDKLPSDMKLQVARKATGEVWQIEELLKTIRIEVEAREASDASKLHKDNSGGNKGSKPPGATNSLVTTEGKIRCVYCNGEHYSASCETIVDSKQRKDILRKSGRCFVCLKTNHLSRNCASSRNCRHCNNRHHQSICDRTHNANVNPRPEGNEQENGSKVKDKKPENVTTTSTTNTSTHRRTVLLQTARAVAFDENSNQSTPVRVLFDNGSQRSYVTDSLRSRLGLKAGAKKEKLKLNTFGETRYKSHDCDIVNLRLKKPGCDDSISISALSYPAICSPLPSKIDFDCPHLEGLELADDWANPRGSIDILIGSDHYWAVVTGEVVRGDDGRGPTAVNSKLGWLLSGPIDGTVGLAATHTNLIISSQTECLGESSNDDGLTGTLKKFWETDAIGIHELQDESEVKPFMTDVNFDGKRYVVGLPWTENRPKSHYDLCFHRLKALQRRLKDEPQLLTEYDNIIKEQLENEIIERVDQPEGTVCEETNVHYMPHHGVVRKDKDTTKLRVVYDGSAKPKPDDLSINDCLDQGPNYIPKLFDVLVKFRSYPVGLTADIEKAFLMVGITDSDRDMLRFLWFNEPENLNSQISCFRFTRLAFGLRPSPAILGSIITRHLSLYKNVHPELIKLIEDSLYVDDLISGAENATKAFDVYQGSKSILAEGSFHLRKWHSNSFELMDRIRGAESTENAVIKAENEARCKSIIEEDQTYTKATVGTDSNEKEDVVKVLGVKWDCKSDELCFDLSSVIDYAKTLPATRRSLLKITAKIFDPLGFLSPFVVQLKCLFQVLCMEKTGWDDALQGDALNLWTSTIKELESLNTVRIPRCYFDQALHPIETQLHAFSDASDKAYAAVIYTRTTYENGKVQVRFVASKTRVAPVKTQTIPRLELLGATILARLVNTVKKSLSENIRIFYWVDSLTVLCWIKHDKVWKQYVSNRVEEIKLLTNREDWRHCPGLVNPADIPSRGLSGSELATSKLWWNGPPFLLLPESEWPGCPAMTSVDA